MRFNHIANVIIKINTYQFKCLNGLKWQVGEIVTWLLKGTKAMIKIAKGREETRPMLSDMDLEDLGKVKGWHPREGIVSQRQTKPGVVLGVVTTHFIKI